MSKQDSFAESDVSKSDLANLATLGQQIKHYAPSDLNHAEELIRSFVALLDKTDMSRLDSTISRLIERNVMLT
jgi:hypothetical protein